MKHILITTIAAVLLAGCGPSNPEADRALSKAATGGGNIAAVKQAIANGADVNTKEYQLGMTALHSAAHWGRKDIAELLIAKGADVNAKDNAGRTPLDLAIRHVMGVGVSQRDHTETVELLLVNGANVNAKNKRGYTPLDMAEGWIFAEKEIPDLLRKHGGKTGEELKGGEPVAEVEKPEPPTAKAPDISIHRAATKGNIEAVKQHLATGTDVDVRGGWMDGTPLHYAASDGHKEIIELLIDKGADVNAKGGVGQTPLHSAAFEGRKEIFELLIANGADVNAKEEDGGTPLDKAIDFDEPEIADLLRKHGGKTGEELKGK